MFCPRAWVEVMWLLNSGPRGWETWGNSVERNVGDEQVLLNTGGSLYSWELNKLYTQYNMAPFQILRVPYKPVIYSIEHTNRIEYSDYSRFKSSTLNKEMHTQICKFSY